MSLSDGSIVNAAKHELVKGLPDRYFENEFLDSDLAGLFSEDLWDVDPGNPGILISASASTISVDKNAQLVEIENPGPLPQIPGTSAPAVPQSDKILIGAKRKNAQISINNRNEATSKQQSLPKKTRFIEMDEKDVEDFVLQEENINTKRKTANHGKLLTEYLKHKGINENLITLPPQELSKHIGAFFITVRQKDGSEYEPVSLRSMLSSFQRHLRKEKYGHDIITDMVFDEARDGMKSKQKSLKKEGYENKPKTADTIEDNEIEFLFDKGELGSHSPQSILNTLWLNNTLHFGMRAGAQEHRNLRWGDVSLHYDNNLDLEYLILDKERQTKTRTGEDVRVERKGGKPTMFAEPGKPEGQCPVRLYKVYSDRRPTSSCQPDSPFYLARNTIKYRPLRDNDQWFLNAPIGVNKISNMLITMATNADFPSLKNKRLTNTSVRKRVCQTLLDNKAADSVAIHVTGHKNPATLNNYRHLTNEQKYEMSHMLANSKSTEKTIAKTSDSRVSSHVDLPVFYL